MSAITTTNDGAARGPASVRINGKPVSVECTPAAERALAARAEPLVVELELYFSCLVKKFVHVRESAGSHPLAWVNDKLAVYFRPVTSTTCAPALATRLGRQPEIDIDTPATRRLAPKRVRIDYRAGEWKGEFWM